MLIGASERTFAMTEQFTLDQGFGQSAAIDRHKQPSRRKLY